MSVFAASGKWLQEPPPWPPVSEQRQYGLYFFVSLVSNSKSWRGTSNGEDLEYMPPLYTEDW